MPRQPAQIELLKALPEVSLTEMDLFPLSSILWTAISCQKRQGASAHKLQLKAAKILPLVGLARSKLDLIIMGIVLSGLLSGPRGAIPHNEMALYHAQTGCLPRLNSLESIAHA
jgi:hypothetical protein